MAKRIIRITESQYEKLRDPKRLRKIKITESQYELISNLIKEANGPIK